MSLAAEQLQDTDGGEEVQQFLTFLLNGEAYGIGILHVKEIIEYGSLTKVPMMPNFIAGVINLRGSVVPVVNLACRFQIENTEITKRTSVIVIEVQDGDDILEVGIVVDMVNEVLELKPDELSPAPSFGAKIRTDFIKHMGKIENDRFMIILDVSKVLSVDELSILQEVSETTEITEEE